MSISNKPKHKGFLVRNLRNFFEHRALWLYFIWDEAKKKGLKPETFAPGAIRRCGIYHGMRALTGKDQRFDSVDAPAAKGDKNCIMLRKKLFPSIGKLLFEMKILKVEKDAFDVDFHYCPLVAAWQKQGCTDEEIDKLCDCAMEGDRGIANAYGCELDLKKTIAKGEGVCEIRIRKKSK